MITRRQFLTTTGLAIAGLIIPELVLPQKTFFLPPPGGWPKDYAKQAVEAEKRYFYQWGIRGEGEVEIVDSNGVTIKAVQAISGPGNGWKIIEGDTLVHEDWSDFGFPQKIRVPS